MTSTAEILKAARKLIEKPENWTQGVYAKDNLDRGISPYSANAKCFCTVGALFRAGGNLSSFHGKLPVKILDAFGVPNAGEMIWVNDSSTHSEVLDLFSKAIAAAEASS